MTTQLCKMDLKTVALMLIAVHFIAMTVASTDDSNQTSLEARITNLEKTLGKLIGGYGDVKGNLSKEIIALHTGKYRFFWHPVAFSAYKQSSESGVSANVILRFESVVTNIGSHYYPQDGIFIAPVTGIYVFYWQMITYGNGGTLNAYTMLMINGTQSGWSYEHAPNGQLHSTGNMVIVEVKEKQHVWIQTNSGNIYFHTKSSFSGYLLL